MAESSDWSRSPWLLVVALVMGGGAVGGHVLNLGGNDLDRLGMVVERSVSAVLDERAIQHVEDRGDFLARIYSEHEECMRDHRKAGDSELDSETVCSLRQLVELSVRQIR